MQVTAAPSAAYSSAITVAELAAALDRLHRHVPPVPVATIETITLTAATHAAQLAAADRSPLVLWHCHKEGHVRFHWPERRQPRGPSRAPTPPLPRPAVAPGAAAQPAPAARPILVVSALAASLSEEGAANKESASATVLNAASSVVRHAIVESGARATVVGVCWLQASLSALSDDLR